MRKRKKGDKHVSALLRAKNGESWRNYPAIYAGLMAKGIARGDIKPRENVFTFDGWIALGRVVKKGEKGVKVVTFVTRDVEIENDEGETENKSYKKPWFSTVFHVSQTVELPA